MGLKFLSHLLEIDLFSIHSVTVNELAYLMCVELMFDGQIDIPDAQKYFDIEYRDNDELKKALHSHVSLYESKLVQSIESKEITATFIVKDIHTGKIIPTQTLLSSGDFEEFLKIYDLDQIIGWEEDFPIRQRWQFESDLFAEIEELINLKKSLFYSKFERDLFEKTKQEVNADPSLSDSIVQKYVELLAKKSLGENAQSNQTKPLINRERETLLLIIAALASESKIDLNRPSKAAENIANLTQIIGCPVGATTIENHLKQIPSAMEHRAR